MSVENMALLTEIRDAMKLMPADPEGLAGWLLSNYRLKKIGKAKVEPTEFHQKKQKDPDDPETAPQADGQKLLSKFMKRTGIKQKDDAHFKNLVKHIKSGETEEVVMLDEDDEEIEVSGSEMMEEEEAEARIPELHERNAKIRELKDEMSVLGRVGKISRS